MAEELREGGNDVLADEAFMELRNGWTNEVGEKEGIDRPQDLENHVTTDNGDNQNGGGSDMEFLDLNDEDDWQDGSFEVKYFNIHDEDASDSSREGENVSGDKKADDLKKRHPKTWKVRQAEEQWSQLRQMERRKALRDASRTVHELSDTAECLYKIPHEPKPVEAIHFVLAEPAACCLFSVELTLGVVALISGLWHLVKNGMPLGLLIFYISLSIFALCICVLLMRWVLAGFDNSKRLVLFLRCSRKNFKKVAAEVYRWEAIYEKRGRYFADLMRQSQPILKKFYKWSSLVQENLGWTLLAGVDKDYKVTVKISGLELIGSGEYFADDTGYLLFRMDAVAMLDRRRESVFERIQQYEDELSEVPDCKKSEFFYFINGTNVDLPIGTL